MFSGRVNQDGFCPAGVQPRLQVPRGEDPETAAPGASGPGDQGQLRVEGADQELLCLRLREQSLSPKQLLPTGLLLGMQHHVDQFVS